MSTRTPTARRPIAVTLPAPHRTLLRHVAYPITGSIVQALSASTVHALVDVTNTHSNSVSVIDPATMTVTATIAVGQSPSDVALTPAGRSDYVVNTGSQSHSVSVAGP